MIVRNLSLNNFQYSCIIIIQVSKPTSSSKFEDSKLGKGMQKCGEDLPFIGDRGSGGRVEEGSGRWSYHGLQGCGSEGKQCRFGGEREGLSFYLQLQHYYNHELWLNKKLIYWINFS